MFGLKTLLVGLLMIWSRQGVTSLVVPCRGRSRLHQPMGIHEHRDSGVVVGFIRLNPLSVRAIIKGWVSVVPWHILGFMIFIYLFGGILRG